MAQCRLRRYAAKAAIILQGGRAADLFYVTQGSVAWILADDQGHALALAYLNAGEFFGEIGLFGEGASRSAQVRARSNCEVAQIRASKLLELSDLQPSILAAMTGQLARCLLAPTVVWAV
ncbi:MAG: cyclic nucleotide-binding domain-containing protein [Gammaproteobacteria bacterium]|nr:cyclic nucleotide-binding domain-containing protein [Gammaproteobacteria bacterium]